MVSAEIEQAATEAGLAAWFEAAPSAGAYENVAEWVKERNRPRMRAVVAVVEPLIRADEFDRIESNRRINRCRGTDLDEKLRDVRLREISEDRDEARWELGEALTEVDTLRGRICELLSVIEELEAGDE